MAISQSDKDWNEALDEAVTMVDLIAEEAGEKHDERDTGDYVDGWQDACARCALVIRDLMVKEKENPDDGRTGAADD